jgi:hypothetical protein
MHVLLEMVGICHEMWIILHLFVDPKSLQHWFVNGANLLTDVVVDDAMGHKLDAENNY